MARVYFFNTKHQLSSRIRLNTKWTQKHVFWVLSLSKDFNPFQGWINIDKLYGLSTLPSSTNIIHTKKVGGIIFINEMSAIHAEISNICLQKKILLFYFIFFLSSAVFFLYHVLLACLNFHSHPLQWKLVQINLNFVWAWEYNGLLALYFQIIIFKQNNNFPYIFYLFFKYMYISISLHFHPNSALFKIKEIFSSSHSFYWTHEGIRMFANISIYVIIQQYKKKVKEMKWMEVEFVVYINFYID